jgi:predicted amidohydrolase
MSSENRESVLPTKIVSEKAGSIAQPGVSPVEPARSAYLTVASVSMSARVDRAANLRQLERFMTDASAQGAHLVVFPEIALQQNPGWGTVSYQPGAEEMAYVEKTAESVPGESTDRLTEKAKQLGIFVIFGMTERGDEGKLYNTSVFLGPEGILAHYRKNALWDTATGGNEHLFWSRGPEQGMVVDSPLGKIGLMICIEMAYEYGGVLGSKGVDLIATVSAWPAYAGDYYEQTTVRNACLGACWHIIANQTGTVGHAPDYGHSRIIDPNGKVIADTGSDEGMVIAKTNLFLHQGGASGK